MLCLFYLEKLCSFSKSKLCLLRRSDRLAAILVPYGAMVTGSCGPVVWVCCCVRQSLLRTFWSSYQVRSGRGFNAIKPSGTLFVSATNAFLPVGPDQWVGVEEVK